MSPLWRRGVVYTCYMLPQTFLRIMKGFPILATLSSKVEQYSELL